MCDGEKEEDWRTVEERLAVGKEEVLGVLSELREGLDIRNFRPFAKAMTAKIKLENSIIVARAMLGPDFLVAQFILRPSLGAEKDHSFGF